jgi:hypothetical protein
MHMMVGLNGSSIRSQYFSSSVSAVVFTRNRDPTSGSLSQRPMVGKSSVVTQRSVTCGSTERRACRRFDARAAPQRRGGARQGARPTVPAGLGASSLWPPGDRRRSGDASSRAGSYRCTLPLARDSCRTVRSPPPARIVDASRGAILRRSSRFWKCQQVKPPSCLLPGPIGPTSMLRPARPQCSKSTGAAPSSPDSAVELSGRYAATRGASG